MKHVPNALTILRILITPVVLVLLFVDTFGARSWALSLFVFASVSDWADGKLARHYAVGSRLGQFLDPLADKVLVIGTFVALAIVHPALVPWWAVVLIAIRAVAVTGLRSWASSTGRSLVTSGAAKTKTAFQLTYLILVLVLLVASKLPALISNPANWLLGSVLMQWLLGAVVLVTLWTGGTYFLRAFHEK